jgi:hypothetical protein
MPSTVRDRAAFARTAVDGPLRVRARRYDIGNDRAEEENVR